MRFASPSFRTTAVTVAFLCTAMLTPPLAAQQRSETSPVDSRSADTPRSQPAPRSRWSLRALVPDGAFVGGFAVSDSRLAIAKFEKFHGRWSLISDLTRDATREQWGAAANQINSRGQYVLWASSTSLRRYTGERGRGLFAEIGGGMGKASLDVTTPGQAVTSRHGNVPFAAWGVGGRRGLGIGGLYVEGGLRSAIPLATRHLYAGNTAPAGSTREAVSYQSWYFGRGKASSQMYVGLGVRR